MRVLTKWILAALIAAPLAGAQFRLAAAEGPEAYAPQVAIQSGDYRAARAAFRTQLLRTGPSPQANKMPAAPAGVTEIEYTSAGLKLKAWVGMPEQRSARMPVVIFLHGGFAFGPTDYDMAEPYRRAGFVIVTPMLRAENGQPGAFTMFYDEVDDVLAVAEFVRAQSYADPARIFLAGHSVGATTTLLASMASPVFKRVAAFSASPDQVDFAKSWRVLMPFDLANPREFEMRSPIAYATSLKSPTRLYVGSREGSYRFSNPWLAKLAKEAKLDVEYKEIEGDHFGMVPAAIQESIAFFNAAK